MWRSDIRTRLRILSQITHSAIKLSFSLIISLTFIFNPRVPDLQDPVLAARLVQGGEPVIRGVAVHARAQQVRVMMSDPGDLDKRKELHN